MSGSRLSSRRALSDEAGAFIVLWALLVVALLTMVAIVIDLSALREDRREASLTADFAATAGAFRLDPVFGGNAADACQAAWDYFQANRPDAEPVTSPPACTGLTSPFLTPCDPLVARSTTGVAGPYTVVITIPVTDDALVDDYTRRGTGQVVNPDVDGSPCARVGVSVARTRSLAFAPVIGIDSSTTAIHSVALGGQDGGTGEPVALLLLEPSKCDALFASGQGGILVKATVNDKGTLDPSDDEEKPGVVFVASDGTGCTKPNSWTIDAKGTQNSSIIAEDTPSGIEGIIRSFALSGPASTKAFDPDDVLSGRLSPMPTPVPTRPTRAPVDHRYNCKATYPAEVGITACADAASSDPHIDQLKAELGGNGPPVGFNVYPGDLLAAQPDAACGTQPSTPLIAVPAGDWFVDCDELKLNSAMTFGGGRTVFKGSLSLGGSASLNLNADLAGASTVFLQSGDLSKGAQATLIAPETFMLLAGGAVGLGGGDTGSLTWTAPFDGPFEDLALWSESSKEHKIGGQAGLVLEGVFFMPNALFTFSGQAGLNQTNAQFIAKRLEAGGQGVLQMAPDPNRVVLFPLKAVRLIR